MFLEVKMIELGFDYCCIIGVLWWVSIVLSWDIGKKCPPAIDRMCDL